MDDVWKDISSLPSLHHHPTTSHHFQDFFGPGARPDGRANTHHQYRSPQPQPQPQPPLPLVTMLSLSTSGNYSGNDQQTLHTNTTTGPTSPHVVKERSPPEYSEKFKRLMKNRESAARSRARKQARANELEQEILRLTKENAKLKRLQKELSSTNAGQLRKEPMLHRTRSSPF